jgi:hypothetical protein
VSRKQKAKIVCFSVVFEDVQPESKYV